ncbi:MULTISPECIES: hypothetical protein [unclassified Paenibacillus]|uniref:hypothetical protein n=1 Tax=unclassified Paenibacillus TaxID=185978 RepID=UPI0024051C2A|nr:MULTISPECIES: hypothetical protein [unclassified Paenibacillus]MDF9845122.1 flagellar biosynthesis chaperone FliJ [Paenibacillus sp. PastF-2]MDF9851721.1 flagellar biosynthesis chaperone FliJ [Paenibacillus sp. PastM-2]MDF9858326.1 flagellar biosynthesis chaperone FliJ [Paenibacillus sp. PastF-1]MDH6483594.1 flagellar biosynthesis chaperone FliJ [Paenibacillus sp. PastH-2]MDH6511001.1 flagellar biosynthesis chaperone FliJ [Paenibacillus sp. PastM-3]
MKTGDKRQRQLDRLLQIAEERVAKATESNSRQPVGSSLGGLASAIDERDRVRQQLEDYMKGLVT